MKDKKIIIGIISIILIIIIVSISIFKNTFSRSDNITITELSNVINNKESIIIYVFNSDSNNKYTSKIFNTLDNQNITYSVFDTSKVETIEYKEFLSILDIDYNLFDTPALIYIQEGIMFGNIININDMDIVDKFISDYDLETLKEVI